MLEKATFLLSTLQEFPIIKGPKGNVLPDIALVGRSNVGKSSLINHLLGQKNLAKTSAKPGKTQLLNFFRIGDKTLLVDLPGYGYAKAPDDSIQNWSQAIDSYLNSRSTLRLILLLIDIRRDIAEEDLSLLRWAEHKKIPLLAVLTKKDKLSPAEAEEKFNSVKKTLSCDAILYSVMNKECRYFLSKKIESFL